MLTIEKESIAQYDPPRQTRPATGAAPGEMRDAGQEDSDPSRALAIALLATGLSIFWFVGGVLVGHWLF